MASVRKLAAEAKVSPATVSRYFTGKESISPALSNRIEEALRRMGETAADKRPLKPVILILLTHLRYSFFSRAIQELLEREYSEHYTFLLVRYDPDYPEGTRGVVNRVHPVGVIYFEEEIDSGILRYIQSSGVRTVMCGGVAVDEGSQMIHVNDIRAAYDGTRYLLDLGHRDILFLSDDISKIGAGYQRIAGSRKAMEERGLFLPGEAVICGSVTYESGYEAIRTALRKEMRFTAVFAFSDDLAVGAMAALFDAGLRVPEDVSVLGYDDLLLAQRIRPRLTTIHQPIDQFIRQALELFSMEKPVLSAEVLLPYSIAERESCKRCFSPGAEQAGESK